MSDLNQSKRRRQERERQRRLRAGGDSNANAFFFCPNRLLHPLSVAICAAFAYATVQTEVRHAQRHGWIENRSTFFSPTPPFLLPSQRALHWSPSAAPLLPLAAAACLALVLPLIVYCGTAAEFGRELHPLTLAGYSTLARRTYAAAHAARGAGGWVEGKDL